MQFVKNSNTTHYGIIDILHTVFQLRGLRGDVAAVTFARLRLSNGQYSENIFLFFSFSNVELRFDIFRENRGRKLIVTIYSGSKMYPYTVVRFFSVTHNGNLKI